MSRLGWWGEVLRCGGAVICAWWVREMYNGNNNMLVSKKV